MGHCNENRVKYFTLYVSQEGVVVGDGQGVKKVSVVAAGMLREGFPGQFG